MALAYFARRTSRRAHELLLGILLITLTAGTARGAVATDVVLPLDAGTPSASAQTTAFNTTSPQELLLAFVSTDGLSAGVTVTGVSGGGLTWALVRRTNAQLGTAEIWRAFAPATLTGARVTATYSQVVASSITVVSFTGVDPSGVNGAGAIGATGSANANPGAPSASLTTTRAGSWVWGVGTDWDAPVLRTVPANQALVHQYRPPVGDTYWVQRQNAPTPGAGASVMINDTAPTNDRYNLTIVEVLAAPAGAFGISGSITPGASGAGTLLTLSGSAGGSTNADAGGGFAFTNLAPGTYTITPTKIGFTFNPTSITTTISSSSVTGLAFVATGATTFSITGTITPASLGSGATVALTGPPNATTTANTSGVFTFAGLPAGTYAIAPNKSGVTFTPTFKSVTLTTQDATGVDFGAATPPTLNYPDLIDIIPASGISVVGTGSSREFQYTHLTFNGGSGPLVIQPEYRPESGNYEGTQYLYRFSAGTWTLDKKVPVGGAFVFHAVHGHFHYPFAHYGLYAVAADGGIGASVVQSTKIGFCIADSYIYDATLPNAGALGNLGSCSDPLSLRGLDIGAVDEYDRTDDGQSVSLDGVPDGTYWLRAIVDPDNFLAESNENNNETDVKLTITGNTVQVLQNITPVLPPLPDILLTAPADGATLNGTVNLTASTPVTSGVQFLLDGLPFGGVVPMPYLLPWNTTTVPNGTHWLAVQTTDANGRTNTSAIAIITVANGAAGDTDPPVVAVADPEEGETVSSTVAIGATVADQSPITKVQFYVDDAPLGAPLSTPPFLTYWDTRTFTDGPHTVTASATDAVGLTGTSAAVDVVVDNSHPPEVITKDVTVSVNGAGTMTTPAFTTPTANDLLVAFVRYDGPGTGPQTASVSGAGLTWTLLKRSNAQFGTSEIWSARANGVLTNATVTSQVGGGSYHGALTVIGFTHAAGAGVVGQTSAPTGEPDIFLPGVAAGSWAFACGNDWDRAVARTPVAGQVVVHERVDTQVGDSFWVQSTLGPSTAFALVTIHDILPNNDRWNYVGVEILATHAAGTNTRPVATVQTPANNSFYVTGQTIALAGSGVDAQTPSSALTYGWVVDLIFGSHVQPAYQTFTGAAASYTGANLDDGSGVHQLIKFTAKDPEGLVSDTARVTIWPEIDLAPSAITVSPDPAVAGQSAHLTFALNNTGRMPAQPSHWVLRSGNTVLGQGDASVPANGSTALAVDATFAAGTANLRLTADTLAAVFEVNEANNVAQRTLTVNPPASNTPPVAVAVGVPSSGTAPLTVNFSGAASSDANGDSLTFAWTFGDAATGTGRLVTHTYNAAGPYAAILTVNDGHGGTDTASVAISVAAPPPAFPATAVLDNFNRANGVIGSGWIDETASFSITANTLAPLAGDHYVEWNGGTFGPNQEAFVTFSTVGTSAPEQNLMLKTQGTTWSSGHIEVSYSAASSRVIVYTFTPPSTWTTRGTIAGVSFAAGDQFGARALADGTVRAYKNGVPVGSASVAAWSFATQGGRIGLSGSGASAARFDNFGGGNAPATLAALDPLAAQRSPAVDAAPPSGLELSNAFPNPARDRVAFHLALPHEADVSIAVVDIQGREVGAASSRHYAAGRWTLDWEGGSARAPIAPGVYLARVRVGTVSFIRRFAIVR